MSHDQRITLMFRVDDTARADIAITPGRTYYRFATDDSIEDGELGPLGDQATLLGAVTEAYMGRSGEDPLPAQVRVQLFVNNRLSPEPTTEQGLRRLVRLLGTLADEFAFLQGFC